MTNKKSKGIQTFCTKADITPPELQQDGWEKDFDEKFGLPEDLSWTCSKKFWELGEVCDHDDYYACEKRLAIIKSFISAQIQQARADGYAKCKEELLKLHNLEDWVVDKAFQDGYAKGRIRCLEQHRGEELEEVIAEKVKKIEEAVEFFDPKNKAIPYVKLDQVLSILKKNDNEEEKRKKD